jgi:hypothetical protein
MPVTGKHYAKQAARWPKSGGHILAQYDEESVVVYQTYRPSIGRFAAEHGYFGGEFSLSRMSWIKPKNDFGLGSVQFVEVKADMWVANMVGQHGTRGRSNPRPIRYDALEECLHKVGAKALGLDASVHMPRIGCGLAGGTWSEVETLVNSSLLDAGVDVFVYDFE